MILPFQIRSRVVDGAPRLDSTRVLSGYTSGDEIHLMAQLDDLVDECLDAVLERT